MSISINGSEAFGTNEWLIEEIYDQYLTNPTSVEPIWQEFFSQRKDSFPAAQVSAESPASGQSSANSQREEKNVPPDTKSQLPLVETVINRTISENLVDPESSSSSSSQADPPTPDPVSGESRPGKDVTRSDLPPAPSVAVSPPTSPYANQQTNNAGTEIIEHDLPETQKRLRGPSAAIAKNMMTSLQVPTATSARTIPVRVLIENRTEINRYLAKTRGGKISFTHLIGYALVEALAESPAMNVRYEEVDGKPGIRNLAHVGFGLAIDIPKPDGSRMLMVPVVPNADTLDFAGFMSTYENLVKRAREGKLTGEDFAGITVTLTNPGTLGTTYSVPRLMQGQGLIIGVGAMDYPAEWAGASTQQLARAGVGRVMTMTSTYDHRVIQGAGSGELLRNIHQKLIGADGFYERVFSALKIPHDPMVWERNHEYDEETEKGKAARIADLIHAYRSRGHLAADTDPLSYRPRRHPDLTLQKYGLSMWDLDTFFPTGGFGGVKQMTLREILTQLRDTYTRTVGIEYMHIQDPEQREWIQERIEKPYEKPNPLLQRHILSTLNHAEAFETFLQTKYIGQKRFSLEGAESLLPLLDRILLAAATENVNEVGIGMAHRGRLNVLANIAGKSYGQIFSEFEGNQNANTTEGSGDVKYHLGTEGVYIADDGLATNVYLAANPSHLEAANGALEGVVRAKLDLIGNENYVIPILIHGDSAFVGQGVVYETLNMSQLQAYRTGGTIHIIVNNQIGFTTGPTSARSTYYCTDLAKGLQTPIFHVNADDPEMVVRVAQLAYSYRQEFHKDVIIDMVCYRRRGHNEGDDPSMTQPIMYCQINSLASTRTVYTRNLIGRGDITLEQAETALQEYHDELDRIFKETREHGWLPEEQKIKNGLEPPVSQRPGEGMMIGWQTATTRSVLTRIGEAHTRLPAGFNVHPKMLKVLKRRSEMSRKGQIDWSFAELIAFGSLLMEGTPIRMSGQDSRRGTFVQRHAVLHDQETGQEWTPLQFLTKDQAQFEIYDSPLSEYAPLAFEYGYSVERPEALVLWEAQFGDFADGAQTVIDEFISSSQQKWRQRSSVVLLLPHGYEGQGPDHSSARIERYLTLCAENNMFVAQPSTPASYFHILRRQAYCRPRKPLIVFTPKQLLRLSTATSSVDDLTSGQFYPVITETDHGIRENSAAVDRVLLCSGRIYYDLVRERRNLAEKNTAIVRLEQLYPLDWEALNEALAAFPNAELVWIQDEPANQGVWPFLAANILEENLLNGRSIRRISRPAAASPAVGTTVLHKQQNAELMEQAFQR